MPAIPHLAARLAQHRVLRNRRIFHLELAQRQLPRPRLALGRMELVGRQRVPERADPLAIGKCLGQAPG